MSKMVDRKTILAGLGGLFLVLIVSAGIIEMQLLTADRMSFQADANVTSSLNESDVSLNNSLGVDATTDRLAFGMMPLVEHEGLSSRRFFNISTNEPMLVSIDSTGNISGYLEYETPQYLEDGTHRIELRMRPYEQGWLAGTVTVQIETVKQGRIATPVGEQWLRIKQQLFSFF